MKVGVLNLAMNENCCSVDWGQSWGVRDLPSFFFVTTGNFFAA